MRKFEVVREGLDLVVCHLHTRFKSCQPSLDGKEIINMNYLWKEPDDAHVISFIWIFGFLG